MNIRDRIVEIFHWMKQYVCELFVLILSQSSLMLARFCPFLIMLTLLIGGVACRNEWLFAILILALLLYPIGLMSTYAFVCGRYKRLSPFFTAYKFPLFKCSFISQKPNRSELKGKTCSEILRMLSKDDLPINSLRPNWTYLTVTHHTVIDRLQQNGIDNMCLWPCYKHSLKSTQKGFLKRLCQKCPPTKKIAAGFSNSAQNPANFTL